MKQVFLYKKEGKLIVVSDNYALVDDDDYENISKNRWYLMKLYHCDTTILYARRYEGSPKKGNHKAILMHREILNATCRSEKVDHKDSNGLNNQKDNIRKCTHSENMSNRKVSYKKSIRYLGVMRIKGKDAYIAVMKNDGKLYTSHYMKTPELAAKAYNELVIKHKPVYGKINII